MAERMDKKKLPSTFVEFAARFPELAGTHERVGKVVEGLGSLTAREMALVKIGVCVGAGLESGLRSHVRRAMEMSVSEGEVEQAIMAGMNTVGFPRTVAAWSWARVQFERVQKESSPRRSRGTQGGKKKGL